MVSTQSQFDLLSYWSSYLQILSVEVSAQYFEELGLPLRQEQFPQVLRLARACLEAEMYCGEIARSNSPRSYFVNAWSTYHRMIGVLGEQQLKVLCERAGQGELLISWDTFKGYQQWIGADLSTSLIRWFEENFPPYLDDTWMWFWAIRLLFNEESRQIVPRTPAPLSFEETLQVKRLSVLYEAYKIDVELRAHIALCKAKQEPASLWEEVLMRFPIDSEGATDLPWMRSLEACLQRRLLRRLWTNLFDVLGAQTMHRLIEWIRAQQQLLPNNPSLSDLPQLLS